MKDFVVRQKIAEKGSVIDPGGTAASVRLRVPIKRTTSLYNDMPGHDAACFQSLRKMLEPHPYCPSKGRALYSSAVNVVGVHIHVLPKVPVDGTFFETEEFPPAHRLEPCVG